MFQNNSTNINVWNIHKSAYNSLGQNTAYD